MVKTYRIKRLWNKLASVRDYVVKDCIDRGIGLQIILNNEKMTIPADQLQDRMFQAVTSTMKSKYTGETYTLIDFVWKPDEI